MWTGEVVSGEPTTLYGHAHVRLSHTAFERNSNGEQSIYDEITSLNPLYNASALQMGVARSVTASSLAKRDLVSAPSIVADLHAKVQRSAATPNTIQQNMEEMI